jgi:hypothetical protein
MVRDGLSEYGPQASNLQVPIRVGAGALRRTDISGVRVISERWRRLAVYGVDGTTLRVSDTPKNEAPSVGS